MRLLFLCWARQQSDKFANNQLSEAGVLERAPNVSPIPHPISQQSHTTCDSDGSLWAVATIRGLTSDSKVRALHSGRVAVSRRMA